MGHQRSLTITDAAQDTGWAGKTVDPHDLASAQVGIYTVRYASGRAFRWERNGHAANLAAGGAAAVSGGLPAGARLVWSYETASRGSSLIEVDYTADKAAPGRIVFTVGTAIRYVYPLTRANARAWDSAPLGTDARGILLSGIWTASEPDGTGHAEVEQWKQLKVGGSVLTRETLSAAKNLAETSGLSPSPTRWEDIFSHTVTAAEAANWMLDMKFRLPRVNTQR